MKTGISLGVRTGAVIGLVAGLAACLAVAGPVDDLWAACGPIWHAQNMTGPLSDADGAPACWWSRSDYDHDGDVDLRDFAAAQVNLGPICPPAGCWWLEE